MLPKQSILGVDITNATEKEILEYILQGLEKKGKSYYVVTPNPEMLVLAQRDSSFRAILNNARLALCDGIGVFWAGKILGLQLRWRLTGVDLLEKLCEVASDAMKKPITVGFLGGRPGVALQASDCLRRKYPNLNVVFAGSEWQQNDLARQSECGTTQINTRKDAQEDSGENQRLRSALHQRSPVIDMLFVALGYSKQEEWMAQNLERGIFRVAMGVGGAFDYISGSVPRAPRLIRSLGFEWLFRLIIQPWRLKRQLALVSFLFLVLKEKFNASLRTRSTSSV